MRLWLILLLTLLAACTPQQIPQALPTRAVLPTMTATLDGPTPIVIPVGTLIQELQVLRRTTTGTETLETLPVRFVPMTGKPGA